MLDHGADSLADVSDQVLRNGFQANRNFYKYDSLMADLMIGSAESQFAASLSLVKSEIASALDQAASQLDMYSETGSQDNLTGFLEEVQQVRGTFKLLDFRAGERVCEELAESVRVARGEKLSMDTLGAFTQAIMLMKRYVDLLASGTALAPSLLIPVINQVRQERADPLLPEAYFFLVNLRPTIKSPKPVAGAIRFPYRRARQLFQLGLLGLMRGKGRKGPVEIMLRAIHRYEKASRGGASWLFWQVVVGALESLGQDNFEMTPQRLKLLGQLDKQVRLVQESEGRAFAEKQPDWLLKEFTYLVALAQPDSPAIVAIQNEFQISNTIKETQLVEARQQLRGPDQNAFESLATALQEELQSVKDQIDMVDRVDITETAFEELLASLERIRDTLMIANQSRVAERAISLVARLESQGIRHFKEQTTEIADDVIQLEQGLRAISQGGVDHDALVDPVSLNEAKISIIAESMTALSMIKRAIGSYLESDGDKLHITNVGKSLRDVAGALIFLEQDNVHDILIALDNFIEKQVLVTQQPVEDHKMEAFADAITAVEYFMDSMNGHMSGADDAIRLAQESLSHLNS